MAYDDWKLASPEGEETRDDDGPLEPTEDRCARHVGEIGDGAKYKPCSHEAVVWVLLNHGHRWPACAVHGGEAAQLGSHLQGVDDDAQVHQAIVAVPKLTKSQTAKVIAIVDGGGDVSWNTARATVLLAEYASRVRT